MAKYYLVASYYNMYTKKYENETEIELKGVDLSTLQKIDLFTSSHTKNQIFEIIEENYGIKNLNHLAIKFYKNKNSSPEPYRVIVNNSFYKEAIKELENIEYYLPNKKVYANGIKNKESFLYKKERKILEQLIKNRELTKFNEIYPRNDDLKSLVNNYLTNKYEAGEGSQENRDYNLIFKEFSKYTTFRNWIISREKYEERRLNNNRQANNRLPINNQSKNNKNKPKKIEKKSIEELEDEYITMLAKKVQEEFESKTKKDSRKSIKEISTEEARKRIIKEMLENINNQTDEYEEFLDEEEIKQMTNEGIFDSYEESYYNNRQIRR